MMVKKFYVLCAVSCNLCQGAKLLQHHTASVEKVPDCTPAVVIVTLLVGGKLCHITNQTSQCAGKAYRDSDYTVVIAIMQPYNNCAETHLGGGVMGTFVFP